MENAKTFGSNRTLATSSAARRGLQIRALLQSHAGFWVILAVAALIRAVCVQAKGYEFDMFMFRDWAVLAHDQGFGAVLHAPDQDYIGYHYVLWLVTALYAPIAGEGWQDDYLLLHVLKIPGTIADLGVIALLYLTTANIFRRHPDLIPQSVTSFTPRMPGFGREAAIDLALLASLLYALNPGVIYATSYWGQLDSVPTFFMLASLAAISARRVPLAWALLAIGFVLKPQAVILYPLLGIMTLRGWGIRGLIQASLATAAVMAVGYVYFVLIGEMDTVLTIYRGIFTDESTKVSTSAWNLWWPSRVFEDPNPSDAIFSVGGLQLSYTAASQLLTGMSGLLALAYAWRAKSPLHAYVAASFLAFSFFMLPMKIHERYLFPILAMMAPLAVQNRGAFLMYLAVTLTFAANLFGVYQVFYGDFFKQREVALICTTVNISCFVLFAGALIRQLGLWDSLRGYGVVRAKKKEAGVTPAS
nr:H138 [uncultured bacterium]